MGQTLYGGAEGKGGLGARTHGYEVYLIMTSSDRVSYIVRKVIREIALRPAVLLCYLLQSRHLPGRYGERYAVLCVLCVRATQWHGSTVDMCDKKQHYRLHHCPTLLNYKSIPKLGHPVKHRSYPYQSLQVPPIRLFATIFFRYRKRILTAIISLQGQCRILSRVK